MKRRFISLVAAIMAFCLFAAMPAKAQDVCEIGSTKYTSITDAITAVPTGGVAQTVIKLLDDITHNLTAEYIITNKKKSPLI